ncbi:carboxylesterase family protein [Streptacidiphilus sp. ASG 303]|uniref:carboxylesterase/lipase family protein n=1 Tax=Streptacidiphilus sp. ASG 303 TaxID=2896847 RepID=UPI001E481C8E|nr:carboxylesterase family protein [Streptacidiphilus sp. ASG 303]MCD0483247.1 carboxylesterase family protein [Streptacidiphilus sp. ASG 303]
MDMIVDTSGGRVRGFEAAEGVAAWLGVPYAAPPFGEARFREPQPAEPWRGVRDCLRFGPTAPQSAELPGMPPWSPGDEDVLTLNVWAPLVREGDVREGGARGGGGRGGERRGGALPVLVWIHGGAYTFGSSSQPDHDGTALARAGLVVVTCNYRVGFEGFGHVPGHPHNRGLLDQAAALRWVRDNAASFGGDPGNVTVAGQSAGGGAVLCLTVMEQARGLFRRAVAHSVPDSYEPVATAAAVTARIAAAAGVAPTAEGLRSAPPEALVAAADRVAAHRDRTPDGAQDGAPGPERTDVLFGPVVDGDVLPAAPLDAPADPALDLLLCHTTEEWWLFDAVGQALPAATEADLAATAAALGLPRELADGYRALMPDAPVADVSLALTGDAVFSEHTCRLAEHHARGGGRAYLARFDRRRDTPRGRVRAWHAADVPFAFGTLDRPELAFLVGGPPDDADRALSDRMVRSWAAFAADGDPGWPPLTADGGPVHVWSVPQDALVPGTGTPVRALWRTAVPGPTRSSRLPDPQG